MLLSHDSGPEPVAPAVGGVGEVGEAGRAARRGRGQDRQEGQGGAEPRRRRWCGNQPPTIRDCRAEDAKGDGRERRRSGVVRAMEDAHLHRARRRRLPSHGRSDDRDADDSQDDGRIGSMRRRCRSTDRASRSSRSSATTGRSSSPAATGRASSASRARFSTICSRGSSGRTACSRSWASRATAGRICMIRSRDGGRSWRPTRSPTAVPDDPAVSQQHRPDDRAGVSVGGQPGRHADSDRCGARRQYRFA